MLAGRLQGDPPLTGGVGRFLREVFGWFRKHPRELALVGVGVICETAFADGWPLLFQELIDRAIVPRRSDLLVLFLGILLGAAVIVSAANLWRDFLYARLITTAATDLRLALFQRLHRLSADYFRKNSVAEISSRFSNDLSTVEHALSTLVAWLVLPGLDIAVGTVLLFTIDWRLALVAQLLWPVALFGPRWISPRSSQAAMHLKTEQARVLAAVDEAASGQAVIRVFGLGEHVSATFERLTSDLARRGVQVTFLSSMIERSSGIGIRLMQVIVLGAGAWLAFRNSLSIGALVAFQALFTSVAVSLGWVTQYLPVLLQASVSLDRIDAVLSDPARIVDHPGAAIQCPDWQTIVLDGVSFIPDGTAVLSDVSFVISRGESVAIVGASGSGKSSLLNLIMRSSDPTTGAIRLGDTDYREMTAAALASQQAAVFPESFLFNTSLRENIRLGRADATDAEIEAAARLAGMGDIVTMLPGGFDAEVGERGSRLSGGQRQRVAIARALLRNPAILLLDEATSALDVGTEMEINRTLEDVRRGRTVISVSHRLASIADYDRIVVLKEGRVVEQGAHANLLSRSGTYAALWQKQSGFTLSDTGDRAGVDAERLKAVPLLRELDMGILERLTRRFATERIPADRTVVQQGDNGDRFYIIVRGIVKVFATRDGEEREVAKLDAGDHFGEIALLTDTPRTATVRTTVPSVFITLSRADFMEMVEGSPELRQVLDRQVASRLQTLETPVRQH